MWQELIGILLSLAKQYEELFSLQEKKRDTLVTMDMARLEKIIELEEIYAKEIERLEKNRLQTLIKMSSTVKGIKATTKMKELAELAPTKEVRTALLTVNNALSKAHKEAKELAEGNSLLIEGALMAINRGLGTIGDATVDPVYGRGGGEHTNHRQNFDFKA